MEIQHLLPPIIVTDRKNMERGKTHSLGPNVDGTTLELLGEE